MPVSVSREPLTTDIMVRLLQRVGSVVMDWRCALHALALVDEQIF
jgi:hypothetical protein